MRDIKFRGKRLDTDDWIYGDLMTLEHFVSNSEGKYQIADFNTSVVYDINPNTIGQYTGLHDKNGKEIYEGDIVLIQGETEILDVKGQVEYSNTFAEFIITNTKSIVNEAEPLGDYEDIEVIGNIYDNPELLEGE